MSKKVIITGVSGQTGSYMVDYLLQNTDHQLYGMVRRLSIPNVKNIQHNLSNPRLKLVTADLSDYGSIEKMVKEIMPDYIINLAANSFVGTSWDLAMQHFDLNCMGVLRLLESIKKYKSDCRFYSAGSSEEDGQVSYSPQDLKHPPHPRSPYGCAKVAARFLVQNYRESYGLYAIHCRCHNHESQRRGIEFVTRKITTNLARIKHSIDNNLSFEPLELGNLDPKRDWSHAMDFCDAIWKALNQDVYSKTWNGTPKEYIFSSQETHTVRSFLMRAMAFAGFDYVEWRGSGADEVLVDTKTEKVLVKINSKFFRPAEVGLLMGDSTPAREDLGWIPKFSFDDLVKEMVRYDIDYHNKE